MTLTLYLGRIGCQLTSLESNFVYQGNVATLNMLPLQYNEYSLVSVNTRKTQMLNMIYPEKLQALHNLPSDRKPSIPPDYPLNEGGWITLDLLPKVSPKIFWLVEYLKMNRGKHVIYTAYSVDVINSFLRLSGFNVINISGSDRQQDRNSKIKAFNETQTPIVLISNLSSMQPIQGATSFVMFEQHFSNIFNNYVQNMSLGRFSLPVIFLVSLGPQNETTLDVQNYTQMADSLNQRDAVFDLLIDPSQTTKYSQTFGVDDFSIFRDDNGYPLKFKSIPI